jgi:predicted unusual protein kinase regulating ubiquinone biosynthesis (AarF/ABC1/UbiB family)
LPDNFPSICRRLLIIPQPKGAEEINKYLRIQKPKIGAPVIIKEMLEKVGPLIQIDQCLSIGPDLIPPEYWAEYKKLQERVRRVSFLRLSESSGNMR